MNAQTIGAFAHRLPAADMEPHVIAAWRALDRLALAEPHEILPHLPALLECRAKLERAIATNTPAGEE